MSALAWLALAAAFGCAALPVTDTRLAALRGLGRLAAPTRSGRAGLGWAGLGPATPSGRAASWTGRLGGSVRGWVASRSTGGRPGLLAALLGGAVGWPLGGPAVAVVGAVTIGLAALLTVDTWLTRRRGVGHAQLLAAVRTLAAELAAGSRAAAALRAAAEVAPRHAAVLTAAARLAAGAGDAAQALLAAPETAALGHAWRVGERSGVALAAVLERVAADLGAADDQRRAVQVALAGPRASAALLTLLPLLGVGLGAAMGAAPLAFLFGAGAGRLVCVVGVALDGAGVLWMRHLLLRAVRC